MIFINMMYLLIHYFAQYIVSMPMVPPSLSDVVQAGAQAFAGETQAARLLTNPGQGIESISHFPTINYGPQEPLKIIGGNSHYPTINYAPNKGQAANTIQHSQSGQISRQSLDGQAEAIVTGKQEIPTSASLFQNIPIDQYSRPVSEFKKGFYLGSGRYGTVSRVLGHSDLVIKVLRKHSNVETEFESEVVVLHELGRLVAFDKPSLTIVQKKMPGTTLGEYLSNPFTRPWRKAEKKKVLDAVESAIHNFHQKGFSHNDLRVDGYPDDDGMHPGNIMIRRLANGEYEVNLIDFGKAGPYHSGADSVKDILSRNLGLD